ESRKRRCIVRTEGGRDVVSLEESTGLAGGKLTGRFLFLAGIGGTSLMAANEEPSRPRLCAARCRRFTLDPLRLRFNLPEKRVCDPSVERERSQWVLSLPQRLRRDQRPGPGFYFDQWHVADQRAALRLSFNEEGICRLSTRHRVSLGRDDVATAPNERV